MNEAKSYTLGTLADLLEVRLEGDGDCRIDGLATLSQGHPGKLSFLSNPAYVHQLADCRASAVILEEKFAAAYWTVDGEARRFDDIGGMFAYIAANPEEAASYWVHDITTGDWIRAEEAYYVSDSDLMTPMGFGIAACATEDQAQALAYGKENVMVMSFAKMLSSSKAMDEMQDDHSG